MSENSTENTTNESPSTCTDDGNRLLWSNRDALAVFGAIENGLEMEKKTTL
jgi:hypothetical protein